MKKRKARPNDVTLQKSNVDEVRGRECALLSQTRLKVRKRLRTVSLNDAAPA